MAKKGNLFLLIKSLSKSEKRYFKLFANMHQGASNYVQLFDAIDKQQQYNEATIRKKFKGEAFLKQLHVTKIYLSNLILKSLRNYHGNLSKDAELKDLLRDIEILFKKELFDQCFYHIQKAEKMAQTYEKPLAQIELLSWKRRLLTRSGFQKKAMQDLLAEETALIHQLTSLNKYWHLTTSVFEFSPTGALDQEALLHHPYINNPDKANTLQAKTLYHHILYSNHIINNNPQAAEEALDELITLIERHPERIRDDPGAYVTALNNKIGLLLRQRRLLEVPPLIETIKAIPDQYGLGKNTKFTIKLWLRTYNIELELYRDTQQWARGIHLIKEVAAFLEHHQHSIPSNYALLLYYQFAYLYFMAGELNEALDWTNKIIGGSFEGGRHDLECFTRLLHLMIHLELGNVVYLKYAIDSTRRYLRKNRALEDHEITLLKFFSKISRSFVYEQEELYRQLYQDLFENTDGQRAQNLRDYLDFKHWIMKKLPKVEAVQQDPIAREEV